MLDFIDYFGASIHITIWFVFFWPVNTVLLVDFLLLSHPRIPGNKLHLVIVCFYSSSVHCWI